MSSNLESKLRELEKVLLANSKLLLQHQERLDDIDGALKMHREAMKELEAMVKLTADELMRRRGKP